MTTQDGAQGSRGGSAGRQPHDRAYFLDLLGDSHNGLGRHEAAIEAYRQAAEVFRSSGAHCSYALCLFKIADSHLSMDEPWHALGYLEACLPLLHDLGLTRHEALAAERLAHCQSELAGARLLGEGRVGQRPLTEPGRPAPATPPATRRQDRQASPDHNGQPGSPRPFGYTGLPASSVGTVDSCYARRKDALAER